MVEDGCRSVSGGGGDVVGGACGRLDPQEASPGRN